MVEIHTFGGLRITRDGLPVAGFTTRKVEALLVYVACQGRPCPRETLADLLWDDRPQAQAQTNLRATLSRLNQHLPEALTIARHTIAVNPANVWLDVAALEAALANTPPDPAQTEEALTLYSGDFLAGYVLRESRGFDDWLLLERERLRQRGMDGLEKLIGLYLSRGMYAEGTRQARRLVVLDPLREEAHRQLMTLLALMGERAAALTQYEHCRRVLAEELGIEPASETTALCQQIERGEVAPKPAIATQGGTHLPSRLVNALPQEIGVRYIGQAQKQAEIREAIAGQARLVSIYGRGGVGKTALARKVLSDLYPHLDALSVNGIVALSALTAGIRLDRILIDVGRLLDAQAESLLAAVARDAQIPTAQKVNVLLEQVRGGRYLLFLDNLETLQDPATGELTDSELRTFFEMALAQSSALCLFITSREPLALPRLLKTWEHLIPLEEGLPIDEACALLQAFDPSGAAGLRDAPESQLRRLAEQTHGFPRALEAVAGLLLETPLLRPDDLLNDAALWTTEVTPTIVQQAIARLGPEAVRVMEALALFGSPVPLSALEFLLAPYVDTSDLRLVLNRLVRAFFVRFDKPIQHFALHPIDQAYCYNRIPEGDGPYTRQPLHLRAVQFFRHQRKPQAEWTTVDDVSPQLAEYEHLLQAGEYDSAAEVLLLIDRDYLWEWGQKNRLKTMHERLQGHLTDLHLVHASRRRLGWTHWPNLPEVVPLFEQNLESARRAGDRQAEADALDDLAQVSRYQRDLKHAVELHEHALAIYRDIGDRRGEGDALGGLGITCVGLGQAERGIAYSEQALAIHRELNHQPSLGFTLWSMGTTYRLLGRFEQAAACHTTAVGVFREINAPKGVANNLASLATACASLGRFEQAFDCLRQALDICRALQDQDGTSMVQTHWGATLAMKGDSSEAAVMLKDARAVGITNNVTLAFNDYYLMNALIASGQAAEAQALMAATSVPPHPPFVLNRAVLVGVAQACLNEADAARGSFTAALEYADKLISRPDRFEVLCRRGMANAGLALLDQDDARLKAVLADFAEARKECAAPGIVRLYVQLLEALMAYPGGERLASVRAALAGNLVSTA